MLYILNAAREGTPPCPTVPHLTKAVSSYGETLLIESLDFYKSTKQGSPCLLPTVLGPPSHIFLCLLGDSLPPPHHSHSALALTAARHLPLKTISIWVHAHSLGSACCEQLDQLKHALANLQQPQCRLEKIINRQHQPLWAVFLVMSMFVCPTHHSRLTS